MVRDLTRKIDLHIPRALEFFEDQLVHAAPGIDQDRRKDRKRSSVFDLARGTKNTARDFHRPDIHTAGKRPTAGPLLRVMHTSKTGQGIHQHHDIPSGQHLAVNLLHQFIRRGDVMFIRLIRGGPTDFGRHTAPEIGDFFRPLVDQKAIKLHLRTAFGNSLAKMLEKSRLPGSRRRHDQPPLAHTDRADQIHHAHGHFFGAFFEADARRRIDRDAFPEFPERLIFLRPLVIIPHPFMSRTMRPL